jgi:hypothetical protein
MDISRKFSQPVMILMCIRGITDYNLDRNTGYTEGDFIVDFHITSTHVVGISLKLDQENFFPHLFQIVNPSILLPFDFTVLAKDIVAK